MEDKNQKPELLPDVHFGEQEDSADLPEIEDEQDDDEQLAETPLDVIDILGFDPLK